MEKFHFLIELFILPSGGGKTHGLEMMATSQVLGHWCKVMLLLKDEVGRLLDTGKNAPL